jgi:D-threonate/D-erythronate kinase
MSGGETAARVLGALGATGIELLGEPIPLMVVGLVIGGRRAGMPVAVKSGAFGRVDAIDAGLRRLAAGG